MAYDFPNAPFVGEEFMAGTEVYKWNGAAWKRQPIPSNSLTSVIHDTSLLGDGTAALPLGVARVDGGVFA